MVLQNCDNFQYIRTISSESSGDIITRGGEGSIWYETDTEKLRCLVYGTPVFLERTSSGSRPWRDISSSSDGTKLAACATAGGYIYTSDDSGATWTERTNAGSRTWTGLASSSDGTKLAACVHGGYIYTSTDSGATWVKIYNSGLFNWYGITSSSDGSKIRAYVNTGYIYSMSPSTIKKLG